MNQQALSAFIWSVADLLRGDYKPADYGKVILPFTVLRRLDCVLAPTKAEVLAEYDLRSKAGLNPELFLKRKAGQTFFNTSTMDLKKLLGDAANVGPNLHSYIQGFSPEVRDIFERFKFAVQIDELAKAKLLYQVAEKFANIDLHPDRVSNSQMGLVFEELIRKFAEAHAGITEIGGRYERKAAGPYDADLIALVERDLEAASVMTVSQPEGTGSTVSYSLNRSWKPDNDRLKAMLAGRLAAFEQVNAKLADLKTRDAEAVATLYAVWNDALIDGEACDDARVIRGFLNEWHPEKREKFKQAELHTWLGWMRRNGIVPEGGGPRTGTGGLFP